MNRYKYARLHGLRNKRVGGELSNSENDDMAFEAEKLAAAFYNQPPPKKLGVDPGWDFKIRDTKIDVKWSKWLTGHLIVMVKDQLRADVYLLVTGKTASAMRVVGWATRLEMSRAAHKDFGYGPTRAIAQTSLRRPSTLMAWCQV